MSKKIVTLLVTILLVFPIGCGEKPDNVTDSNQIVNQEETEDVVRADTSDVVCVNEAETSLSDDIHLKDIYADYGIKVGTCLSPDMVKNSKYSDLITSQFNSVTMENAMKPENILSRSKSVESGELSVEFGSDLIKMLDWAKDNKMAVRGHTLVWYSQTPRWIFCEDFDTNKGFVSREIMLDRMESMIKQTFGQIEELGYSEMFYAYDVVNEAWLDNGGMRKEDNPWYEIIGEDYPWYAFYYANMYAPENISLFYNDFNEQYKYRPLMRFIDTLVDENGEYLIDGIGLQAHLYTLDDMNKYLKAVKELGTTGLKIEITELDICLGSYQNTLEPTEDNLRSQGKYYYNLLSAIADLANNGDINMDAITFWGFADAFSWRREGSPLMYDGLCNPKYAFYGAAGIEEMAGF